MSYDKVQGFVVGDKMISFAIPEGLNPQSSFLIAHFAQAMAVKMRKAEIEYGYTDNWQRPNWEEDCRQHFLNNITKGDPTDVAIYCAFMHYHKWRTEK